MRRSRDHVDTDVARHREPSPGRPPESAGRELGQASHGRPRPAAGEGSGSSSGIHPRWAGRASRVAEAKPVMKTLIQLLGTVFSASAAPGNAVPGPGLGHHAPRPRGYGWRLRTPTCDRAPSGTDDRANRRRRRPAGDRARPGDRRAASDGPHEVGLDEVVLSTSPIGSPTILLLSGSAPPTSCAVSGWTPPSAFPVRAQPGHPALWADAAAGRGARDWWVSGHDAQTSP
jgi:hypothetical protein